MNRTFIVFFVITIVAATALVLPPIRGCHPEPVCGKNEAYSECANDCMRCFDKRACPAVCKPGCMCKEGYIRNSAGACVRFADCS